MELYFEAHMLPIPRGVYIVYTLWKEPFVLLCYIYIIIIYILYIGGVRILR